MEKLCGTWASTISFTYIIKWMNGVIHADVSKNFSLYTLIVVLFYLHAMRRICYSTQIPQLYKWGRREEEDRGWRGMLIEREKIGEGDERKWKRNLIFRIY